MEFMNQILLYTGVRERGYLEHSFLSCKVCVTHYALVLKEKKSYSLLILGFVKIVYL